MPLSNKLAPIISLDKARASRKIKRAWDHVMGAEDCEFDSPDEGREAAFDSNCPWCDDHITTGDIIFPRSSQWVCGDCAMSYDCHPSNSNSNPNLPRSS
jgi:hypothetical protein